jgi:hypothetical protein
LLKHPSGTADAPTVPGVRPGWLPTNLLLLAGTVFIVLLVFFLSDLFTEDARSTGVIVVDALAGALFIGFLCYLGALPGGVAYLLLLRRLARRVSGLRLRAVALLLSPIVTLYLVYVFIGWPEVLYPLAFALPYGLVVRLPRPNQPPVSNA